VTVALDRGPYRTVGPVALPMTGMWAVRIDLIEAIGSATAVGILPGAAAARRPAEAGAGGTAAVRAGWPRVEMDRWVTGMGLSRRTALRGAGALGVATVAPGAPVPVTHHCPGSRRRPRAVGCRSHPWAGPGVRGSARQDRPGGRRVARRSGR